MKRFFLVVYIALSISCKEKVKQELYESRVELDSTKLQDHELKQTINVETENFKFENEIFNNWLKLGTTESEIIKNLGVAEKDTIYFNEVNGYNGKDIFYLKRDLKIILNDSEKKYVVEQIEIGPKCSFKTKFNIGIGSNFEDVIEVYSKYINKEESSQKNIVIGDVYFGLHIFFDNEKVNKIILGSLVD
jgi:hypothetical protein